MYSSYRVINILLKGQNIRLPMYLVLGFFNTIINYPIKNERERERERGLPIFHMLFYSKQNRVCFWYLDLCMIFWLSVSMIMFII